MATMRRWCDWFTTGRLHVANIMGQDELRAINVPALVMAGTNELHPEHTAQEVATALPNAKIVKLTDYYSEAEMRKIESLEEVRRIAARAPVYEEFIARTVG